MRSPSPTSIEPGRGKAIVPGSQIRVRVSGFLKGIGRAARGAPWPGVQAHREAAGHRGLERAEVVRLCQAAGVASGPVLEEGDVIADPHLAARGFFRRNGSVDVGEWDLPGHLWRWDGPPLQWGPIQRMGADNHYVLREVVGIDDETWDALDADGQLSDSFLDPDGNPY